MRRTSPRNRRRGSRPSRIALTDEQRLQLRAALRDLKRVHRTWARVATALGIPFDTIYGIVRGTDFGSMKITLRVAMHAALNRLIEPTAVQAAVGPPIPANDTCIVTLCPTCLRPFGP